MKVIVTIGDLDVSHGGPTRSVPALCNALAHDGVQVELLTSSAAHTQNRTSGSDAFRTTVIAKPRGLGGVLVWRSAYRAAIKRSAGSGRDVVLYNVGIWLASNHVITAVARRRGLPLVISPRGMLSRRALEVSRWKKRVAWRLYQRRDLQLCQLLHVTSDAEADDCRAVGLSKPIAVIPNGVDLPPPSALPRSRARDGVRSILFLGRIHPIKGLSNLMQAWAEVRRPGWKVVIAGPDHNGHCGQLKAQVAAAQLEGHFEFVGAVADEQKWEMLRDADLFVLPSYSENFGLVVAEALAAGLPVITTRATPWGELVSTRSGWWIETGVPALTAALREATELSPEQLQEMGARGRLLVESRYSWNSAAEKMLACYRWLLGQQERPNCVQRVE